LCVTVVVVVADGGISEAGEIGGNKEVERQEEEVSAERA